MFYFNPPNKPTPKDDIPQSSYLRFRFDPSSTNPKLDPENLFKINGEFPVIDSRFFGKKYSKFFLVVAPPAQNKVTRGPMATINNTITMCDIDDRVSRSWYAGPMCGVAEVAFCPRSADGKFEFCTCL
jgi:carotenoid cleavage dioxygenase